jgi:hypothetical protein
MTWTIRLSGTSVEDLSQGQDPWRNARVTDDRIITDASLKEYFESLQADPPDDQRQEDGLIDWHKARGFYQ